MKDIQVINDVMNGELDKYTVLIDKYHNELFQYLHNVIGSISKTEEILQEIFFKSYQHFDRFDSSYASYRIWMYRISGKHLMKYLKTYQKPVEKTIVSANNQVDKILLAMAKTLRPKHFKILSLCYFSNLELDDISKSLNSSEKSVQRAIKRSMLKVHMKELDCGKVSRPIDEAAIAKSKEQSAKVIMNRVYVYKNEHK